MPGDDAPTDEEAALVTLLKPLVLRAIDGVQENGVDLKAKSRPLVVNVVVSLHSGDEVIATAHFQSDAVSLGARLNS